MRQVLVEEANTLWFMPSSDIKYVLVLLQMLTYDPSHASSLIGFSTYDT